jgi:hypothetical protein
MVRGLTEIGWRVDVCGLDGSFPFPTEAARKHARRSLAAMDAGTLVLADGLAFGAMADEADAERDRLRFVALVHHPLALEQGLDEAAARRLVESETRALAASRGVVVTSAATVQELAGSARPRPTRRSSCSAWPRSHRERAMTCCSTRWRGSAIGPGT